MIAAARVERGTVALLHRELADDELEQVRGHVLVVDYAHGVAEVAVLDALLHLLHQALRDVVVHVYLRVAHHAQRMRADIVVLEHEENLAQAEAYYVVEINYVAAARRGGRQLDEARAGAADGNLHYRVARALRRLAGHFHAEVDCAVAEEGHLHRLAHEEGHYALADHRRVIVDAEPRLLLRQLRLLHDVYADFRHFLENRVVGRVELLLRLRHARVKLRQDLHRLAALRLLRRLQPAELAQPYQLRDAYLYKLVLIVRKNTEEAQPLHQRHAPVLRLLKHPVVENKPAQLSVVHNHIVIPRR